MKTPKISIVINTYNRALTLDETLSSLYYLEYPEFEVIVVNGPSTDNTEEVLDKYKNDIKIAKTPERNLSVSRNIGIAMASGEYVAFIDDDAIPDRKWLNNLLKAFNTPEVAGCGGDIFNDTGIEYQSQKTLSTRFGESVLNDNNCNNPPIFPNCPYFISVTGVNSIFNKDILLEIGGFDEQYDYFLDETDVCARMVDAGYYINYAEGANVYHKFAPSHLRNNKNNNKLLLDYTSIMKNIIYYANQYKHILSSDLIEQKTNSFVNISKDILAQNYKDNNLTKKEYTNALQTIDNGLKLGKESVKRGYRLLIKEETLQKYKSDFQKFPNFFNDDFSKKKTIVFITHEYLPITGGTGYLVYTLALELVKKGYNVHVITSDEHKYNEPSVKFQENIWVHRIKTKYYDFNFLRKCIPYDIDLSHEEISLSYLRKLYTIYEEIKKIQENYDIDIVHGFLPDGLILHALKDEKLNCIMTLLTASFSACYFHAASYHYDRTIRQVEKYCAENCKNILGDSNCISLVCKNLYKYMNNPKVILLGLQDLTKKKGLIPKEDNAIVKTPNQIEILFIGRFEERKGIDLLLSAIPEICQKHDNVVFRLVGDCNSNPAYKEVFLETNINLVNTGKIIFEGRVEDTVPYYKNCDIFVAPSRFESFGLVYVEAMMFSKPVIGTNISAIPEVVDNNVTGILVELENINSLKEAMIKLIEDPQLREVMGKAGRKRYEEKFTSEIMINNMINYYNSIIENKLR